MNRTPLLLISLLCCLSPTWAAPSRLKDIAVVNGLSHHKLLGYGLVAGLAGTGDSDNCLVTARGIANMLDSFGVTIAPGDMSAKNMAAVIITGELPPVVAVGTTLDVTVSSLADAKSLQGGTLLLAPLRGVDGQVYALAQGPISIGGFEAQTRSGDSAQKNHPTVGRVPSGASVVLSLSADPVQAAQLTLSLLRPDFTTAVHAAEAINNALHNSAATALDNATVRIALSPEAQANPAEFITRLEELTVEPDSAARVVINERTGTVVIGQHVRIAPVAICQGGLTVEVKSETQVSPPPPIVQVNAQAPLSALAVKEPVPGSTRPSSAGQTVVVQQDELHVKEMAGSLTTIPEQATLEDLVKALNALGVKPRDLIAIIQALKEAQALQAEVILF